MNPVQNTQDAKAWVLYDGDCSVCLRFARRFENVLTRHGFALLPLQTPWVRESLGLSDEQLLAEMRLLFPDERVFGGADAVAELARHIWWAWPLWLISRVPGLMPLLRRGYRGFAAHRRCANEACEIGNAKAAIKNIWLRWIPAPVLPAIAIALGWKLPAWTFMWMMAFAIFLAAKWVTLAPVLSRSVKTSATRILAYVFLWPGMNAMAFCTDAAFERPAIREWLLAFGKVLFGAALIWLGVKVVEPANPLVTGWIGMFGIIFLLHFGTFHLLSLAWRMSGVNAKPIMRSPIAATSLAQFWGDHWNNAFSDVMQPHVFLPLTRRMNARAAMLMVFLISGLLHELVISLPARGGYGLPTLYFVTQGFGFLFERSKAGRAVGLGHGLRGWVFTVIVAAGPVFWLFHPIFVRNVILPMLQAIGAT